MKKLISLSLALMLLLSILAVPAMAEESNAVGQLSYLAMTEEEDQSFLIRRPLRMLLDLRGVVKTPVEARGKSAVEFYDSLDALLMGFQAGKVNKFVVPYYTARYLSSTNDGLRIATEFYPEKATGIGEWALSLISDGYSFLLKEENTALRDELDAQLTAMKEDGTLQKLID